MATSDDEATGSLADRAAAQALAEAMQAGALAARLRRNVVAAECVSTPDDLIRTAVRLLLLTAHSGLSAASAEVRQSKEARRASQALYAAGDFFNRSFDPSGRDAELRRLCNALHPLAAVHGCDPFMLHLYAAGLLRRRKKRAAGVTTLRDK
jgi:hypothetical protein